MIPPLLNYASVHPLISTSVSILTMPAVSLSLQVSPLNVQSFNSSLVLGSAATQGTFL
jgi:hypothetical protein